MPNTCAVAGCRKPAYVDRYGRVSDACSKSHRDELAARARVGQAAKSCLFPECQTPRHPGSTTCTRTHRNQLQLHIETARKEYLKKANGAEIRFDKEDVEDPFSPHSLTSFLGNFHPKPLGPFPTREACYQAAKFLDLTQPLTSGVNRQVIEHFSRKPRQTELRQMFPSRVNDQNLGHYAWYWGQPGRLQCPMRSDFHKNKVALMENILRFYYANHPEESELLLATGTSELVEWSQHGDAFWGKSAKTGKGENHLGRLHMKLRAEMQENQGKLRSSPASLEALFGIAAPVAPTKGARRPLLEPRANPSTAPSKPPSLWERFCSAISSFFSAIWNCFRRKK